MDNEEENVETSYEFACMRAELLGLERPSQEEFEANQLERLKQLEEEQDVAVAEALDDQLTEMKETGGKLDEINSILSSTQQKLNRFGRATRCSLSNIFHRSGSVDVYNESQQQSMGAMKLDENSSNKISANRRNTTVIGNTSEIILAQPNLGDENKVNTIDVTSLPDSSNSPQLKGTIAKNMTSHLDKLDSLINKAEQAELSMSHQTKQMRKMIK